MIINRIVSLSQVYVMHFLILADNYYPSPLANSICVRSYLEEFKSAGHQCTIINRVDDGAKLASTDNVYSFSCSKRPNYKAPFDTLYKVARLFVYPHIYNRLVRTYYDKIMQMDLSQVDVLLSVCNPIESVIAALMIKERYPNIRQVIYNVDTLSDFRIRRIEGVCCPFWHKLAYRIEKKIFNKADIVIFLKSHQGFYAESKYSQYSHKFLFQDVPLFKVEASQLIKDSGRCLYAGRFYKDFREPKILLNLFNNTNLMLDIYTTKRFCKVISKSASANINVQEYIPEEELNVIMKQSKILISIGNKSSNMFPSKTVSYVSMCKPIIHIYHDDIDPVVDYLKDYPDVLFIDLRNSLAKNRALVAEFCSKVHPQINTKEVSRKYETSTPKYCATVLLNQIAGL